MDAKAFKRVFERAMDPTLDMSRESIEQANTALSGIALSEERRVALLDWAAYFLRYHCQFLNGSWDAEELQNFRAYFKKVDLVL